MTRRNWLTALLTVVLALVAGRDVIAQTTKPVKQVATEQFDKLRQEKDHVVLDVRTAQEYSAGHVPGAINIDINDPQFKNKVAALDKSKTYLVHCAKGVRSARAAKIMSPLGFDLLDYRGGFDEWKKSGKPVDKGEAKPGK